MTAYDRIRTELPQEQRRWLITGVAGFIGSHLLEELLRLGQRVVGLDNLSTGTPKNLDDVRQRVGEERWQQFEFIEGTVADIGKCRDASHVEYVLHHAAFISVPLSMEDPIGCHDSNVTGTLNLLTAARDNRVRRVVYASSSAVYGDDETLPKVEEKVGRTLSPYAATKAMDETYARLFADVYGLGSVGLRYFNVFGARQNPIGGYAAVIPQWIAAMLRGNACRIHGDGSATRDFCPVSAVVQANLLAATAPSLATASPVYNVGLGSQTSLLQLHALLAEAVTRVQGGAAVAPAVHGPERPGDILHSGAEIAKIKAELGFAPDADLAQELEATARWYSERLPR